MKKLAIIGSNDLAQLIAHHAIDSGQYSVVGFFDNMKPQDSIIGKFGKVVGNVEDVNRKFDDKLFDEIMIGVGYTRFDFRKECFERFDNVIPFANIVHRSSYVDRSCLMGVGNFILPGCVVDYNCKIGNNILLNTGSIMAHDVSVSDHTFIAPGVRIAGYSNIGSCCLVGVGSTIIDNIVISDHVVIGGGAVVISSINEKGTYVGCPAKKIERNESN